MAKGFVHRLGGMTFRNSTRLDSARLMRLLADSMADWSVESLAVSVRYTRTTPYSGTCYPGEGRIFVNIGRDLEYPYKIGTHIAPAVTTAEGWCKPVYTVACADGYQLAVFIFRHECYHWLLRRAGRNERQKESMCDRFATRWLVDRFGCCVSDERGRPASREIWDTQDVDRFVAAAQGRAPRDRSAVVRAPDPAPATDSGQRSLFVE